MIAAESVTCAVARAWVRTGVPMCTGAIARRLAAHRRARKRCAGRAACRGCEEGGTFSPVLGSRRKGQRVAPESSSSSARRGDCAARAPPGAESQVSTGRSHKSARGGAGRGGKQPPSPRS
jgi:hypothetical protein